MKFFFKSFLITFCFNHAIAQCDSTCSSEGICCRNNPAPAGVMISNIHSKGEWMFSYRHTRMYMDNVVDANSSSIGVDEQFRAYDAASLNMQMRMHMLMGMYGVTDKLTAMVMLHYMGNEMKMMMPGSESFHTHTMRTSGIADSRVTFLYSLLKQSNKQVIAALGVNIPSGSINEKGRASSMMYPNTRFPYMMQLGSGTLDALLTLSYLRSFDKIYLSTQANVIIRPYKNSIGYQLGNEYALNSWIAWQINNPLSASLRLESAWVEKIIGLDSDLKINREVAANVANTGGFRNFVYAGFTYKPGQTFFENFRLCAEFGLPVYQRLNGWQSRQAANLNIAINYSFK